MDEDDPDELREKMAELEAEEAQVSALRRHLHRQIDYGYATEDTHARERDVSARRRELHRSIDSIRERLGLEPGPLATLVERPDDETQGMSMGLERTFLSDAGDDLEDRHLLA